MTYVRTKIKLESLADGEILEVLLKGDEPLQSVPSSARDDGHEVISVAKEENEVYRVLLRKRGGHDGNRKNSDAVENVYPRQG